ncbi:hypothetical protein AGMMS49579_26770 [Spirochaetia bacterium]|nr:hypothetical protein AGMMS49579_26770 [Spirochaetia bacterium]
MEKTLEDYFSELQADMIAVCMAYVKGNADKIYIYCSYEGMILVDFFYCINNKLVKKHKLNDISPYAEYDLSIEHQKTTSNKLLEDIKNMAIACQTHKCNMPTEIKIIYDVITKDIHLEYKYEIQYTAKMAAYEISEKWFKENERLIHG